MHCDIKEQNLMLKTQDYENPEAVFIDYGVTREFTGSSGKISGTPGYIPPETWQTGAWYPRGDCFSMGVTILQVMSDHIPINGRLPIFAQGGATLEQWARITATRPAPVHMLRQRFPRAVPLISNLLEKSRPKRRAAVRALEHPWLSGMPEETPLTTDTNMPDQRVTVTTQGATVTSTSGVTVTVKTSAARSAAMPGTY